MIISGNEIFPFILLQILFPLQRCQSWQLAVITFQKYGVSISFTLLNLNLQWVCLHVLYVLYLLYVALIYFRLLFYLPIYLFLSFPDLFWINQTFFFFFFFFKWLCLRHVKIPRPGTESKPQLQPTPQLWQSWILCAGLGIKPVPLQ